MSLLEVYWRALRYLAAEKQKVTLICAANVALGIVTIAEPVLFGQIIDAIAEKDDLLDSLALWAGLGIFNIIAFVLVARGADRLAHARRVAVLCDAFERVISMPLSWHQKRGTSNALHTLLRAVETLFGLWLEFMRTHLSTAVALAPSDSDRDLHGRANVAGSAACSRVAYLAIGRLVMHKTKDGQARVEKHYHDVFSHVTDSVSNVTVLQSYNRVTQETQALRDYTRRLFAAQFPVLDWWALASALHRLASTLSMMVVLLIGAWMVSKGQLRIGDIVAFTGFATLMISRLDQVSAFVNQIFEARAKAGGILRSSKMLPPRLSSPRALSIYSNVAGNIVFEDVSFAFPNSGAGLG